MPFSWDYCFFLQRKIVLTWAKRHVDVTDQSGGDKLKNKSEERAEVNRSDIELHIT